MSAQFLVDFGEEVEKKIHALVEQIASGQAGDFTDYKRRCAEVKAYRDAFAMAKELFKKGERDDE